MFINWKSVFGLGVGSWLLLNLLQAALLQLDPDEAYYWMYAQQLDWGYFDHPPMVALLISLGSSWLPGELGVRLGSVLMFVATLYALWCLLGKPTNRIRQYHFLLLAGAMPVLHVYGFVSTPDSPLLLFTALFFLTYKNFLAVGNWRNTLWLGIVMALLLYSKYHGVLVIFFSVLSNLRLLSNPKFYLASMVGAGLYFPHLYWQFVHDFPTFRYHLSGRNDTYELKYTLDYLLSQLLIFSPFLLPFIFRVFSKKPKDLLERAFYFVSFGFWAFFFYSTFNGHVEPHWTAAISVPIVVLLYRRYVEEGVESKRLMQMAGLTLAICIIIRVGLFLPIPNVKLPFTGVDWVHELKEEVDNKPIVFINSYRDPSIYSFYTGSKVYTYTDILYRLNQFDIWGAEKEIHGMEVILIGANDWETNKARSWRSGRKEFKLNNRENFQVTQKLEINWVSSEPTWLAGDTISLAITLCNPTTHNIDFQAPREGMEFVLQFDLPTEHLEQVPIAIDPQIQGIRAGESLDLLAHFIVPQYAGRELLISFCLKNGDLRAAYLSPKYSVHVN